MNRTNPNPSSEFADFHLYFDLPRNQMESIPDYDEVFEALAEVVLETISSMNFSSNEKLENLEFSYRVDL